VQNARAIYSSSFRSCCFRATLGRSNSPRWIDEDKHSTLSGDNCFTSSRRTFPALVTSNNQSCSKDKSDSSYSSTTEGVTPACYPPRVHFLKFRLLLFPSKRTLKSDFSHRSDRSHGSVRNRFQRIKHRWIELSQLDLQAGFSFVSLGHLAQHCVPQIPIAWNSVRLGVQRTAYPLKVSSRRSP
jgi:hypothetical protein